MLAKLELTMRWIRIVSFMICFIVIMKEVSCRFFLIHLNNFAFMYVGLNISKVSLKKIRNI